VKSEQFSQINNLVKYQGALNDKIMILKTLKTGLKLKIPYK